MAQKDISSQLQEKREFPPSAAFRKQATIKAAQLQGMYDKAAEDYIGFWADLAVANIDWHRPFTIPLQLGTNIFLRHTLFPDSTRAGNATRLLPQYVSKSVLIEKEAQLAAVVRSPLQIVQRCVKRHVTDDSGQAPRQIGRFLVFQQFSSDRRRTAQFKQRDSMKI